MIMMHQLSIWSFFLLSTASSSIIHPYSQPEFIPYPYTSFRTYPTLFRQPLESAAIIQDARYNGGFAYSTQEFHGPLSPFIQSILQRFNFGYAVPTLASLAFLHPHQTILVPQPANKPEAIDGYPAFYPLPANEIVPQPTPQVPTSTGPTEQPTQQPQPIQQDFSIQHFPIPTPTSPVQISTQQPQIQESFPPNSPDVQETNPASKPELPFGEQFANAGTGDKGLNDDDTISVEAA